MKRIRQLPEALGHNREVLVALRELYLVAGEPSMREIERSAGHKVSHDTAHRILTRADLPRWESLKLIVEALNGDVRTFRDLWLSARRATEPDRG